MARRTGDISHLTEEQLTRILEELGDLTAAIRDAAPEQKLEVYRNPRTATDLSPGITNGAGRN